jgi:hypothetical protein
MKCHMPGKTIGWDRWPGLPRGHRRIRLLCIKGLAGPAGLKSSHDGERPEWLVAPAAEDLIARRYLIEGGLDMLSAYCTQIRAPLDLMQKKCP